MDWKNCISDKRTGKSKTKADVRTSYQRDYDRLIFSSAFRRLQNKTQVFPLPGNTFVHNRLTHSLEVASVGRSLGSLVGNYIASNEIKDPYCEEYIFYKYDLPSVIAAGCLAHDIGNPPFGHSGEKAISSFFMENADTLLEGKLLKDLFSENEWSDLIDFEGNANAFHVLTHKYVGKLEGGQSLTYSTLASILKYPCASYEVDKNWKHRKKYGYFELDEKIFKDVVESTNMYSDANGGFKRHPFVYLVEAADDICYRIIDMEDAHRINLLDTVTVQNSFLSIISDITKSKDQISKLNHRLNTLTDDNERISYLRAISINVLVHACLQVFTENMDSIIKGNWNDTLMDVVESHSEALRDVAKLSIDKIYNHRSVIEVEIAGYRVISGLLELFLLPMLKNKKNTLEKKTLKLIPNQYLTKDGSAYEKSMGVVDFIAGMTDGFATELYRKAMGIEIASHR